MFNPIRQSEKYDPLFQYIKKYVHELRDHECRELHDYGDHFSTSPIHLLHKRAL
ncbi:hypothetical protein KEJ14_02880 [Candidatus Bathyarchaeota archaeon]|nr:hypothetical protein [Candidatus Bathyarchaeota archaeon]